LDDEDEVLLTIAEQLGEMCNCVGGDEYMNRLLLPLELLAAVEESSVREMTLKSIGIVVNKMSDENIGKFFIPFLSRLSTKDWFTSRISAASLFHIAYMRLPDVGKSRVRPLFLRLCSDDTPSVRRAAAVNFSFLTKLMKPFEVFEEFMGVFNCIAKDEQDSVRIQAITICISLASILDSDQQISHILPVVVAIGGDRSWRVRWSLACRLHELCEPLGSQVSNNHLSVVFEGLLNDSEAEVRSAAAGRLALICSLLRKGVIISKIIPGVQRLVTDSSEHVRASLASVVNGIAISLGREDTVERLLPILLLLLRDEVSEVCFNRLILICLMRVLHNPPFLLFNT
jgi:serine/threonine-protein phosphatase 2A regulatory subunit A